MKIGQLKTIISLVLCITMMCPLIGGAAWDGSPVPEDGSERLVKLIDLADYNTIVRGGAVPSVMHTEEGAAYSMRWKDNVKNMRLMVKGVERDWSQYESFKFDIYSKKAVNSTIRLQVFCDHVPTPGTTTSYWTSPVINLNFEGTRTIEILPDQFSIHNFADWSKVYQVNFIPTGINPEGADADIYISSLYGVPVEKSEEGYVGLSVSSADRQKVLEALGDATAIMSFAGNTIINGEIKTLHNDEKIYTADGVSVAPLNFFANILGAEVSKTEGDITVNYNGKSMKFAVGSEKCIIGGEEATLPTQVIEIDGLTYIALKCLENCGIGITENDKVTVIGNVENAKRVFSDKKLNENIRGILNLNRMTAEDVSSADWKAAKDRWRKYLVGDETTDINDKYIAKALKSVDNACETAWKNMHKDTKILALFGTTPCKLSTDMTKQFTQLESMAIGYGTYGSKYYKNEELRRDILFAFDWLYENLYGKDEMKGTGWRSTKDFDWWDWYVGSLHPLANSLLIMEEHVSMKQVKEYLSLYNKLRGEMRTQQTSDGAASRIYGGTLTALLEEDFERITGMANDYNLVLNPPNTGTGVLEDGLYMTHFTMPYTTLYGTSALLGRVVVVSNILSGTKFELATPYKYNICNWLYDTFEPVMFNGMSTMAFRGRLRDSQSIPTREIICGMLDCVGAFGLDDDIHIKEIIKRHVTEENKDKVYSILNLSQTVLLSEILNDNSIVPSEYNYSKIYYTGDSVMHHMDDERGFALKMASSRVSGWESTHGKNMDGWYQSDGMLYMYVDGDEEQYNENFWNYANKYHLPGTTVDTSERVIASISDNKKTVMENDFAGATGFDDKFSTAAMQLISWNYDKEEEITTETVGGGAPKRNSTLKAKKAWFMFDDEVVALGTDINSNDGYDVHTVVDNRWLKVDKKISKAEDNQSVKPYQIVSITASANDGNVPENTIDNDYKTRWSASGDETLTLELSEELPVGYVGIAQFGGTDGKQAIFDLEVSSDGINWTKVWSGKASGTTVNMEAYDMKNLKAKFIRYSGHGRTNSVWNSITEMRVFPPSANGTMDLGEESGAAEKSAEKNKIYGVEDVVVDGNLLEKETIYTKEFNNPNWMHVEGISGYVFPSGGNLTIDKTFNTKSFLEVWFNHGNSPKNGKYEYILLPQKTAEETAAYSQNTDVEILRNDEKLQAVREKTLGITGMVFWEAGSFENISTDNAMIIMGGVNETGNYMLSISDPTQLLTTATVVLDGEHTVKSADERLDISFENGKTIIRIDFVDANGRPLKAEFEKNLN